MKSARGKDADDKIKILQDKISKQLTVENLKIKAPSSTTTQEDIVNLKKKYGVERTKLQEKIDALEKEKEQGLESAPRIKQAMMLELKIDVLKNILLTKKIYSSSEELNKEIIKATTGGPIRFRPMTREELEEKVKSLESDKIVLQRKLNSAKELGRGGGGKSSSSKRESKISESLRSESKLSESKEDNNNELDEMEDDFESPKKTARSTKTTLSSNRNNNCDDALEKQRLNNQIQKVELENKELKYQLKSARDLIEKLKNISQSTTAFQSQLEEKDDEIEDLNSRNVELENQVRELKKQTAILNNDIELLNSDKQNSDSTKSKNINSLHSQIQQLQQERDKLQQDLQSQNTDLENELDSALKNHDESRRKLTTKIQQLEKENGELTAEVKSYKMEREKRIDKMRELNLIIDDYKVKDEKYSDTQIIYNQMKTQYEKMQVDYKAIEQEVNALRINEEKNKIFETQCAKLQIEKDELNTEYNNYVQQHKDVTDTLNAKNAEVEEMKLKMEEMKEQQEFDVEQLNGQIQMLKQQEKQRIIENENNNLKDEIKTYQAKYKMAFNLSEAKEDNLDNSELKSDINRLITYCQTLEGELGDVPKRPALSAASDALWNQ